MAAKTGLRRVGIPLAVVVAVSAIGAGVYPALAGERGPELPEVGVDALMVRIIESETEQLSGTVRVRSGFDVPGVSELARSMGGPAGHLAGLATGNNTLRIAVDGPERQRLVIAEGDEEFSVFHVEGEIWMYDGTSNTAYHAVLPREEWDAALDEYEDRDPSGPHGELGGLTPQEAARQLLEAAGEHAEITVDGTARVAGREAYEILVVPTGEEARAAAEESPMGAVESVRIAVDAETGVPLAVTIEGTDRPLLDIAFSRISYEKPAGGSFDFTPPADAEIVDLNEPGALDDLALPGLFGGGLFADEHHAYDSLEG
ncbi:hypothetical protein FNQ90_04810 [Streptomyces alkaliphilus]|uniref:DUF2092 domain-containing protein n=1 Tax=Streptomyces alkaliphilus TaxID=1472722 RepID=A0A7W3Y0M3_9ACTN|nr:hypothetical protein [Streptomyces alkaliphilus]MBB0243446.1 hypothetical protein [Streptomyces alkaliphilus]